MDRIYNSLKNAQGGGYMGVTATCDQKLTIHNDAVVFVDELSKIMDVPMVVFGLSQGTKCVHATDTGRRDPLQGGTFHQTYP